jgi:hypothetical protein
MNESQIERFVLQQKRLTASRLSYKLHALWPTPLSARRFSDANQHSIWIFSASSSASIV